MHRKLALATLFVALTSLARAEAPAETGVPDFALAKLTIAKMGVFLDKNADFANQIVTNAGPLAKMYVANIFYKIPVDESLNFDGSAQIFLLPPLTFGGAQETAAIFPVSDAKKLKANIVSVYGDPVEQEGVMTFTVPQPLPLPDKTLVVKIDGQKALLAPDAGVLKQLAIAAAAPPSAPTADAELIVSVPNLRKLYGANFEAAMQFGAYLASENVEGLKTVTGQLDEIIKTIWEVGAVELRLDFDKGSKNLSAELAIVPLKGTRLAQFIGLPDGQLIEGPAGPPPGLDGKNAALLGAGAPINLAFRMNGRAIYNLLPKLGVVPKPLLPVARQFADFLNGESALAIDPDKRFALMTQHAADGAPLAKKVEALHLGLIEMANQSMADLPVDEAAVFTYVPAVESVEHKGVTLTLRKTGTRSNNGNFGVKTHDESGTIAQAEIGGQTVLGFGSKPEAGLGALIDSAGGAPVSPEHIAAFAAPPPGTLFMASVKLLEMVRIAAGELLPDNIDSDQIVSALPDAPVSLSVFMHGGKAGLRAKLPGTTAGALFAVNSRLRHQNIDVMELVGMGNKKAEEKIPGNIPAPPPQK